MGDDKELISVIIPVYNAQIYLGRCLDTVMSQSYRNLEIILIDDGSTDDSGKICDNYCDIDDRIYVVHKKNEGPAEARNVGIRMAKGRYIAFVDSDDYVCKDYIDVLYNLLKYHKADISICGYYVTKNKKLYFNNHDKKEKSDVVVYANTMLENWHGRYKHLETMPWNKLYKKELFEDNNITFPKGAFAEDVQTLHLLVAYSDKIVITTRKLYFYYQRKGSLTHSASEEKVESCIYSQDIRLQYFKNHSYEEAYERLNIKKHKYYILSYCTTSKSMRLRLIKWFKEGYDEIIHYSQLKLTDRIIFLLFKKYTVLLNILFRY